MSTPTRPITILIAALGGEGGGVLTDWIVNAATRRGFPVQSTSIPGVAQRTGATTYYIEIVPASWRELGDKRPVLALTPGIGDIDVMVASELLEAGRAVSNGFITPDRTLTIASTSRFYAMDEKIAMGDGRTDPQRLRQAIAENSKQNLLIDLEAVAKQSGAMINAVLLGTIAGSGSLPIPLETFETAIREDGKAVEANLRGFRAGVAAARAPSDQAVAQPTRRQALTVEALEREAKAMPTSAQDIVVEGIRRLVAYQSLAYARLYLDRLAAIQDADAHSNLDGVLLRETAKHLAVRMSFEDVSRVAEAKIAPARLARIAREELRVGADEPFAVYDFLKPGIEELCQVLPPFLARPILDLAGRRGWLGRVYFGMEINSTSVSGYLRFLLLAKLKRWRRFGHRYHQEQEAIVAWLAQIAAAAKLSGALALEIAECARLIKGYGDTHARGVANYRLIAARVIMPALSGQIPPSRAADAIASARTAALVDPEGESLARCLVEIEQPAFGIAAE
ncbi:MAG TPA: indolepyruvate oxidoreductase subunit beta family protein [Pseudolabrys sp.]|nr:indolepyruvate oxidoreductase subunit beta family protein [Pseudolabrys sp.]